MNGEPQACYLDESGNNGFDFSKQNVSSHFVIGGPIVDSSKLVDLEKQLDEISQRHFSGSEIKSSNVAKDDQRRLRILDDILKLDFHIYCLVINKKQLKGKGLRFKRSFYKFLNRLAYEELFQAFPRLMLFADEIGGKEFMDGFVKYVDSRILIKDLFDHSTFGFQHSGSSRLIQLADFVVGTIARCYDSTTLSPRANELMDILFKSKKLIPIREWPKSDNRFSTSIKELVASEHDKVIKEQNLRLAQRFLDDSKKSQDALIREQAATLNYLMFNVTHGDPTRYIGTKEILDHLNLLPDMHADKKMLGRSVIDKLRDAGVMISSNRRGYKLVMDGRDLDQFVRYYDNFIGPMLGRLRNCRNKVLLSTKNKLDIVDAPRYIYLKAFFDKQK